MTDFERYMYDIDIPESTVNETYIKQLNRLVIAKITSHPDERTLASIPTLTGQQILRATRHIRKINKMKAGC